VARIEPVTPFLITRVLTTFASRRKRSISVSVGTATAAGVALEGGAAACGCSRASGAANDNASIEAPRSITRISHSSDTNYEVGFIEDCRAGSRRRCRKYTPGTSSDPIPGIGSPEPVTVAVSWRSNHETDARDRIVDRHRGALALREDVQTGARNVGARLPVVVAPAGELGADIIDSRVIAGPATARLVAGESHGAGDPGTVSIDSRKISEPWTTNQRSGCEARSRVCPMP
jgi:hypothetical protein